MTVYYLGLCIKDCPTRWGSMEAMISRLLEQEDAVRVVLGTDQKTSHHLAGVY